METLGRCFLTPLSKPDSPAQFTDKTPVLYREGYEYYRFDQIDTITPRPVLFVAGADADTLYYCQDGYNRAKEPKELFLTPGATHMDLYDKPQFVVPIVAKLKEFFGKALRYPEKETIS